MFLFKGFADIFERYLFFRAPEQTAHPWSGGEG